MFARHSADSQPRLLQPTPSLSQLSLLPTRNCDCEISQHGSNSIACEWHSPTQPIALLTKSPGETAKGRFAPRAVYAVFHVWPGVGHHGAQDRSYARAGACVVPGRAGGVAGHGAVSIVRVLWPGDGELLPPFSNQEKRDLANESGQKISYAKNRSDTLSKLTGTYKQAAPQQAPGQQQPQQQLTAAGSLQESVFAAPPGVAASLAAAPTQPPPGIANTQAPPQGLPQKLANGETGANGVERAASPGEKRKRGDEGEDEAGDAPRKRDAVDAGGAVGDAEMEEEEDDDDGGEMELDSDDD